MKKLGSSIALCVAVAAVGLAVIAPPASALTQQECSEVVAEGQQAREDLATLIAGQKGQVTTPTTSEAVGSYVAALLESAQINEFGFVSADAGAPLELCLPKGTTKLTMHSTPVVLWEGEATTDAYPVTVTIPADTECGKHTMEATGTGVSESTEFTVAGECVEAAGAESDLPRTGAAIGGALALALALLAVGVAAQRARRARLGG